MLDDILHVLPTVLHSPHQVQQRVVAQLEGTQERGRFACHNLSAVQPIIYPNVFRLGQGIARDDTD